MKYKYISLLLSLIPLVMSSQLAAEPVNTSRYWPQFEASRVTGSY